MTKSVKRRGPSDFLVFDDEVFAKLERELGPKSPDEKLRDRLSSCVLEYEYLCQHTPPTKAAVRRRLVSIKKAAIKLYQTLNENPTEAAARTAMSAVFDRMMEERTTIKGKTTISAAEAAKVWASMRKELERLPNSKTKIFYERLLTPTYKPQLRDRDEERYVLMRVRSLVPPGIDLADLSEKLDRLCRFVEAYQNSTGGRPGFKLWNQLMLKLAAIYEEATGKEATVTENEHRARAGERYSGAFVRVATIVDHETASRISFTGVRPRPNSALGPALRRLLEARSAR